MKLSRKKDLQTGDTKRTKISQAGQYVIFAVFGASAFLGTAIALVMRFTKQISFNTNVIAAEEKSVVAYSDVIKNTGVCKKPKGSVYTDDELKKCNPADISVDQLPNTLRFNIINNLSMNQALNSVSKQNDDTCRKPNTQRDYTLKELNEMYDKASDAASLQKAANLIKVCSALRTIPDALPAFENQEALLASLNKIFLVSGWSPENLRPGNTDDVPPIGKNIRTIPVSLSVESDSETTIRVLRNIERSIRSFDIYRATIEWGSNGTLVLQGRAAAYYVDLSTITETTVKVSGKTGDVVKSKSKGSSK